MKHGVWKNPLVELWHLNSALWALTLDPASFVRSWWEPPAGLTKRRRKKSGLWGETMNLFPWLALISPGWVCFIPTHKQSPALGRRRAETQMKDACWTSGCCWDLCSLSDSEGWLSFTSLSAAVGQIYWKVSVNLCRPVRGDAVLKVYAVMNQQMEVCRLVFEIHFDAFQADYIRQLAEEANGFLQYNHQKSSSLNVLQWKDFIWEASSGFLDMAVFKVVSWRISVGENDSLWEAQN